MNKALFLICCAIPIGIVFDILFIPLFLTGFGIVIAVSVVIGIFYFVSWYRDIKEVKNE